MFTVKRAFFQWFLIVVFLAVGGYYAFLMGFISKLLLDETHISLVILAYAVFTILQLGLVSWRLDYTKPHDTHRSLMWSTEAISNLPLFGIFGTVVGFITQSETLASGAAGLGPLGTSLFASLFGIGGALVVRFMRFNVKYNLSLIQDENSLRDYNNIEKQMTSSKNILKPKVDEQPLHNPVIS